MSYHLYKAKSAEESTKPADPEEAHSTDPGRSSESLGSLEHLDTAVLDSELTTVATAQLDSISEDSSSEEIKFQTLEPVVVGSNGLIGPDAVQQQQVNVMAARGPLLSSQAKAPTVVIASPWKLQVDGEQKATSAGNDPKTGIETSTGVVPRTGKSVLPPATALPAVRQDSVKVPENHAIDLTLKLEAGKMNSDGSAAEIKKKPVGEQDSRTGTKAFAQTPPGIPLASPYPGVMGTVYAGQGQLQMVQILPMQYTAANLMCWPQLQMLRMPGLVTPPAVTTQPEVVKKVGKEPEPAAKQELKAHAEHERKRDPPPDPEPQPQPQPQPEPVISTPTTPTGQPSTPQPKLNYAGYIDTKDVAERVIRDLKKYCIPQAVFAQVILGRTQGTLSDLLRKPKPWSKLKSGRETFYRMYHWLQIPEHTRISGLKSAAEAVEQAGHLRSKRKSSTEDTPRDGQISSQPPKKSRKVFTSLQRETLTAIFKETKRPSKLMQKTIADQLGLKLSTVANFFMNARRRSPEMYTEDGKGETLHGQQKTEQVSQENLQTVAEKVALLSQTDAAQS